MAKRKDSTSPETNDKDTSAKKEAAPRGRKKADPAAAEEANAAAAAQPAAKRGRKKAAEAGVEPAASAATGAPQPAKKRGRPKKAAAEEVVPVEVAARDGVFEAVNAKVHGHPQGAATVVRETGDVIAPEGQQTDQAVWYASLFTDFDVYLFKQGKHHNLYLKLGSHPMELQGRQGTYFAVWAPNAEQVWVMGEFNAWSRDSHQLHLRQDGSGIWEGFIPDVRVGTMYKYHIKSQYHLYHVEKSDPFAFCREMPPHTASIVSELTYEWHDQDWIDQRKARLGQPQPYSVYEVHLGSWRRKPEEDNRPLSYRELAEELPAYVKEMGYTHVELMPVMHHPFSGSWGYQITGYFAAHSLLGSPTDLMYLIDKLHQHGIGVIMDWVPSHFPSDEHGLAYFDGTHLFEHADPRKGFHPDWNSYIFNYGRSEVRSFLISNALFWLDKYHVDGLRVDAVASMLYLDYSRREGEWIPNEHGGRENLEAISFLKEFNQAVHDNFPEILTIAEESTAWPAVTGPVESGGLGFDMKWMMGWMHDTLRYFSTDPIYRRYHQGEITFSIIYAFSERFMLPLSHDEVVHGKGSLLGKMPGDEWQRFANLRTLLSYMFAHPGGKLTFMGSELAQSSEWNHDSSLDWHLLQYGYHQGIQQLVRELNALYKAEPAMYRHSFSYEGFQWVDLNDTHNSVISFLRKGDTPEEEILVVCNFTPVLHEHYRIGSAHAGKWVQIFNSDDRRYGGSDVQNAEPIQTEPEPFHSLENSMTIKLPPLGVVYFKRA